MPIACTLSADELRRCASELLPGLAERARSITATPTGARLTFAVVDGLLGDVAHVLDRERGCCPFLGFVLEVPAGAGEATLVISGPDGTAEFLRSILPAI